MTESPARVRDPSAGEASPAEESSTLVATTALERLQSDKVLVTGARGFIGRHLVARLLAGGVEVHATTRALPPEQPGVRWWRVNLSDQARVAEVIDGVRPNVIVHLASRAEGSRSLELVVPMINDNVMSAISIMAASAALPGCQLVLAGSVEERGVLDVGQGARSPYAASKAAATMFATLYRDLSNLQLVVLRLAMVYGPDEPNGHRLVPYVVDSLLRGIAPRLSSGHRLIDWVYVDDVVDALLAATLNSAVAGHVFDVGPGAPVTIRRMVSMIADAVGAADVEPEFGAIPERSGDRDLVADPDPARRILGWSARTGLTVGIRRTVAWHQQRMEIAEPRLVRPASA